MALGEGGGRGRYALDLPSLKYPLSFVSMLLSRSQSFIFHSYGFPVIRARSIFRLPVYSVGPPSSQTLPNPANVGFSTRTGSPAGDESLGSRPTRPSRRTGRPGCKPAPLPQARKRAVTLRGSGALWKGRGRLACVPNALRPPRFVLLASISSFHPPRFVLPAA